MSLDLGPARPRVPKSSVVFVISTLQPHAFAFSSNHLHEKKDCAIQSVNQSECLNVQWNENKVDITYNSIGGGLTLLHYGMVLVVKDNFKIKKADHTLFDEKLTIKILKLEANLWEECEIGLPNNLEVVKLNSGLSEVSIDSFDILD